MERERVERNIFDKLCNAAVKGELSIVKDILENNNTALMVDENGQTSLYAACIGNQVEIIELLIDSGCNVNHQDNEGKTVLHIAFDNHAPDLAQTLITRLKANTEIRDKQNWTPLHTAIDRGYSTYSQQLLANFLQKDASTEVSWIQLHAACLEENKHNVQLLLDANTNVNHANSAGYAPLHITVAKCNVDLVTLLLDQSVDVNSVTIDGKTPLHIAAEKGHDTIIQKLLISKADPSLKDVLGNTCLHLAVQLKRETKPLMQKVGASYRPLPASYYTCSIQTVQAIIDHGADVNAVNNRGQTALWFACKDGQDRFVKTLSDARTDPNINDKYGDSCLHAVIHGNCSTATIQRIIDRGADVNATNKDGSTPLLLACSTAQAEAVKLFLNAKADPNIPCADGDTSLHASIAADCSIETIQEIIDYGGKVNAVNKRGRTALLLGCFYRQMDSVKVLLEAGADPTIADEEGFTCLHAAIDGRCSKDTLQALIDHGAHINARRRDGTNALLNACQTGQSESVRFLLDKLADVSIGKPDGNTCLHIAVHGNCSKGALQKIIEQGMDVNIMNNMGETALILACESAQAASVNVLLEKGADPNISDGEGYTCLHAAVHGWCANETLKEIINHKAQLDAQNLDGETALSLACLYRQQDSVKILLNAGSNTNITNNNGNTCLHAAVYSNCNTKMIQAIIDHGVNVNATNETNKTALMGACLKGNIDTINVLLNAGADPKIVDANDETWLHYAAVGDCSKEVFQTIINHGANVNATSKHNETALMTACENGNLDAINVLLSAGADPDIVDTNGNTWLHCAAGGDCSKEVLQAIINHGADVNAKNKYNATALMKACLGSSVDAIDVLLSAGADPDIIDIDANTWLYYAADGNCSREVLQAIINHGADVNAKCKDNATALMRACGKGSIDAINVLLSAGSDPNIVDKYGNTCLHLVAASAAVDCSNQVLQTIINHGADVNANGMNNATALMAACWKGNIDDINVLLSAGADPYITDVDGNTWLHWAADGDCSKEVIQAIINHGVDVNAKCKYNRTALMVACSKGNIDAINALLSAGADSNIVTFDGYTCLHYAVLGDCSKEVIQAIINHGAVVNAKCKKNITALMRACGKGNRDAINVLLNAGADPNINDSDGDTCLHYAAGGPCSKDVIQEIINHVADVNAKSKNNTTALMRACQKGNIDAINVLINAGADPNIVDANINTCLHHVAGLYFCKDVLQAIISYGVDVDATNNNNETALMKACSKGNIDAVNILLNAGADPNVVDAYGDTCLHYAVGLLCSHEVLQAIVNSGVNANAVNSNNNTAFMKALLEDNNDAMDKLRDVGADRLILIAEDNYSPCCCWRL